MSEVPAMFKVFTSWYQSHTQKSRMLQHMVQKAVSDEKGKWIMATKGDETVKDGRITVSIRYECMHCMVAGGPLQF